MVEAYNTGQKGPNITATGFQAKQTLKENLFTSMVILTKENGSMTNQMAKENIPIQMGPYMKEIGKMINNMVRVRKFGLTVLGMKEIIITGKNMEKENFIGQMGLIMKGNLRIIILMDSVSINLEIIDVIKEPG